MMVIFLIVSIPPVFIEASLKGEIFCNCGGFSKKPGKFRKK